MNTITTNGVSVSINTKGSPMRQYFHNGKYFIESREDTEYTIDIHNSNYNRIEAVVSVDGLSVINGKSASKQDIGYVINAYDKISIKGYRKSNEEVGAFKFTKKRKSYAASKGDKTNVGVIAVAVFSEKTWTYSNPITIYTPTITTFGTYSTTDNTIGAAIGSCSNTTNATATYTANCSTNAKLKSSKQDANFMNCLRGSGSSTVEPQSLADFDHGTKWGQKIQDKVTTTTFERFCNIFNCEIFYNSKEKLQSMGVKLIQEKYVAAPRGFPVDFATPPAGWQG